MEPPGAVRLRAGRREVELALHAEIYLVVDRGVVEDAAHRVGLAACVTGAGPQATSEHVGNTGGRDGWGELGRPWGRVSTRERRVVEEYSCGALELVVAAEPRHRGALHRP